MGKWEKKRKNGEKGKNEKGGKRGKKGKKEKKEKRKKGKRKEGKNQKKKEKKEKIECSRKIHYDVIYFRLNIDNVTRPARHDSNDPYPTNESYRAAQLLQKLISFFFWAEKGNFWSFSGVFPLSTFLFA